MIPPQAGVRGSVIGTVTAGDFGKDFVVRDFKAATPADRAP